MSLPMIVDWATAAELSPIEWQCRRRAYLDRVEPWVVDRLGRMSRQDKHPVKDFLFEYYSFRPAHLMRWTPGFGVRLKQASRQDILWKDFTQQGEDLLLLPESFPQQRLSYLDWAIAYLEAVCQREPSFHCFGLHEWAMVYRESKHRHSQVPLRLGQQETDAFLESQTICCTHYDAFRFFTPLARPKNRFQLTRELTIHFDQPGCLHVTMDLYRFAYKIAPYVPSELLADALELAASARELDMRASPYDLRSFGYEPIPIETREGREVYVHRQRDLFHRAAPIRQGLLKVYRDLREQASTETRSEGLDVTLGGKG